MKRLARVVARSHHAILLELVKGENCTDCPANCNKPLINMFGLKNNLLTLSVSSQNYDLSGHSDLISQQHVLGQPIHIKIDHHDLMKSSAFLYLVPLLIIIITLSLGHLFGLWLNFSTDLTAGMGVIIGLLLVYLTSQFKFLFMPLKFRPKVTIL